MTEKIGHSHYLSTNKKFQNGKVQKHKYHFGFSHSELFLSGTSKFLSFYTQLFQ